MNKGKLRKLAGQEGGLALLVSGALKWNIPNLGGGKPTFLTERSLVEC